MMDRLFGTDGARGVAVTEFTCETALLLGRAVALKMCSQSEKPKIIVAMLENSVMQLSTLTESRLLRLTASRYLSKTSVEKPY